MAALALASCSDQIPPPNPASFSRPQRVAFACFDTVRNQAVPLATCLPDADGVLAANLALHALVARRDKPQIARVRIV